MRLTLGGCGVLLCIGCGVPSPVVSNPSAESISEGEMAKGEPSMSGMRAPKGGNERSLVQAPKSEEELTDDDESDSKASEQEPQLGEYPVAARGVLKWLLKLTYGYLPRTGFRVRQALTQVRLVELVAAVDSAGFFLKDINAAGERTCLAEDVGIEQAEMQSPCRDRLLHMLWEFRYAWRPESVITNVEAEVLGTGVMIRIGPGDYDVFVSEKDGRYFFKYVEYFISEVH